MSIPMEPMNPHDGLPAEPGPVEWTEGPADGDGVVVIIEMSDEVYRLMKPTLDKWIAKGDLTCHVRFDNER